MSANNNSTPFGSFLPEPDLAEQTQPELNLTELAILHGGPTSEDDDRPQTRQVLLLQFKGGEGGLKVGRLKDSTGFWIHFSHSDADVYVSLDESALRDLQARLAAARIPQALIPPPLRGRR